MHLSISVTHLQLLTKLTNFGLSLGLGSRSITSQSIAR